MGIWDRLTQGLKRTQGAITGKIVQAFESVTGEKLDDATADTLEEALLTADLGPAASARVIEALRGRRGLSGAAAWREALASEIAAVLERGGRFVWDPPAQARPWVILVVGVNGVGKTTMIGKLAAREKSLGRRVLVVAADTFRAAAADQLAVWAERAGAELVRSREGADPASVAFDGVTAGIARGSDTVIVDTAGRLHTKSNLMDELSKIHRVIGRALPGAPHTTLLALDATLGQNTLAQARTFREGIGVDALLLNKLDGTAKGGAVVALIEELGLPVALVGVGEGIGDWSEFDATTFARALVAEPASIS
ncbi:MAG: signal recognition particle-docking protein FtsY [Candidatus Eiseniibacteriota bacterium]